MLDLSHIGLTGSIPPEIGNLANLQTLALIQQPGDFGTRGAGLTGSLPPELGRLANLVELLIGQHALSGPLPPELGNLSKLEKLVIAQWQGDQSRDGIGLTGTIPRELGQLTSLEELWLNSNHLSGTVPPEIGNLAGLRELLLDHNELEGRVPDAFLNLDLERFQWHNNPLCLPATPAFQEWRGRIRLTEGPYCGAGAAAAEGTGVLQITKPIAVEPLVPCTVLSGSGTTGTGKPRQAEHAVWTGAGGEVIHDASIGCPSYRPNPP